MSKEKLKEKFTQLYDYVSTCIKSKDYEEAKKYLIKDFEGIALNINTRSEWLRYLCTEILHTRQKQKITGPLGKEPTLDFLNFLFLSNRIKHKAQFDNEWLEFVVKKIEHYDDPEFLTYLSQVYKLSPEERYLDWLKKNSSLTQQTLRALIDKRNLEENVSVLVVQPQKKTETLKV